MTTTYNVYCDESCHLEHDRQSVMVLGAVWCPIEKAREIALCIRQIKERHGLKSDFEIKWTKVSPAKEQFYVDVMNYFFNESDLHFRALIVPDKSILNHEAIGQSHDDWYFKMHFNMLRAIFRPEARYRIYLDIKDTRSAPKVAKLWEILCNERYDFSREVIERIQTVRSHEVEQLALADLLIGAIAYANRRLAGSSAKQKLVELMRLRSHYKLTLTTLLREDKVNLFQWQATEL
jgi:hypothetical protein